MQADCYTGWRVCCVRLTAGALAACDVLQILRGIIGDTLKPYAFPSARRSKGWWADTVTSLATYLCFGFECCAL
eukprot:15479790-Alexandrium_andersonii.AAC.1